MDERFVVGDRVKTAQYGHIGTVVRLGDGLTDGYPDHSVMVLMDVDKTGGPWPCPPHMLIKLGIIDRLAEIPNEADLAD